MDKNKKCTLYFFNNTNNVRFSTLLLLKSKYSIPFSYCIRKSKHYAHTCAITDWRTRIINARPSNTVQCSIGRCVRKQRLQRGKTFNVNLRPSLYLYYTAPMFPLQEYLHTIRALLDYLLSFDHTTSVQSSLWNMRGGFFFVLWVFFIGA